MEKTRNLKLKDNVALEITFRAWSNRGQVDKEKIRTGLDEKDKTACDKGMLTITKKLLDSVEYNAIKTLQSQVQKYIQMRSVPSFQRHSVYLFAPETVESTEKYLEEQVLVLDALVENFLSMYQKRCEDSAQRLRNQYNKADYPSKEDIRRKFKIQWRWTRFDVSDKLPSAIAAAEREKAEAEMAGTAELIQQALRQAFKELIDHASEQLKSDLGDKPKAIKDALMDNIYRFINTFNNRNLTNDEELSTLVAQAKGILENAGSVVMLKSNTELRNYTQSQFSEMQKTLDGMIGERARRKFDFSK